MVAGISAFSMCQTTLTAPAWAAPVGPGVAILTVEVAGDAAPELREPVQRSLAVGLRDAGLRVITTAQVVHATEDIPELAGCTTATCLQRIGSLVHATYFLQARVDAAGSTYTVQLALLSARGASKHVTRRERRCPVCTIVEVTAAVRDAAKQLGRRLSAPRAHTTILTRPPGALVSIDGREVGAAPLDRAIPAGHHTIAARLTGYATTTRQLVVPRGGSAPTRIEIPLTRARAVDPRRGADADRSRIRRSLAWITTSAAIATVVVGATLVAVDGHTTCGDGDTNRRCNSVWHTSTAGWITLAAGAGLGGTAAWLHWRDRRARRRPQVTLAPTAGGAVGGITLRW